MRDRKGPKLTFFLLGLHKNVPVIVIGSNVAKDGGLNNFLEVIIDRFGPTALVKIKMDRYLYWPPVKDNQLVKFNSKSGLAQGFLFICALVLVNLLQVQIVENEADQKKS